MNRTAAFLVWAVLWASAASQYLGEEELDPLQKTAVIGGEERDLDQIGSTIYTNKTVTELNCASGYMNIGVTFHEPFFGIIYPNGSRTSACLTHGTGDTHYVIDLPLKGCGTRRVERRVFVNNIIVRFHKGLELEGDEVKTIICRYPSPVVLPPPVAPVPFIAVETPHPVNRVGEVEILMIICAIVFLALLLVGMACSYTCLKKRNIRIVRTRPMSLGPPSEISKLSASSLIFDGLKIPRAHATTSSDSDTALVSQSETLPSDYPSESPSSGSEVEELDVQEVIEDDRVSSVYSDAYVQSEAEIITAQQVIKPPKPTFMVRVKNALTPPRTPEPDYSLQNALSQSLTTILERDESFRPDSLPGSEHALMMTESEDDMYPPPILHGPPDFEEVQRRKQLLLPPPPKHFDMKQIDNVTLVQKEITEVDETINRGKRRYLAPRPPSEPDSDYPSEARSVTDTVEALEVAMKPDIATHTVDDRYLTTITETSITEDVQKHHRYVKQYHMKPKPIPPPKWNVAIRHYPGPKYADELESSGPEWEAYSEPGSDVFRSQMMHGADETLSQLEYELLEHPPPPSNWTALIRVLEPPPTEEATREILSSEDREKWRQIITTESTLRTMLTTATIREDYERIRRDQRYEQLFEPTKWDVIIRILSPPTGSRPGDETSSEAPSMSDVESLPSSRDQRRYRRYDPPAATGGRRANLPPLYEYDADGNPIVSRDPGPPSSRSRRSSKSSLVSGVDVRSIPETEVNFSRAPDTWSEASGPSTTGGPRSHADRSHSEITFRAAVLHDDDYPDTDYEDRLSGRTVRSLVRSGSEFTEDWRHQDQMERYSHSSADSKPNRQAERSTSEYMEEAPHLSDFPTSPEVSPQLGVRRFQQHESRSYGQDNVGYVHEEHFEYTTEGGQRVYRQEIRSGYHGSTGRHVDYRVEIPETHIDTEVVSIEYPDKPPKTRKK